MGQAAGRSITLGKMWCCKRQANLWCSSSAACTSLQRDSLIYVYMNKVRVTRCAPLGSRLCQGVVGSGTQGSDRRPEVYCLGQQGLDFIVFRTQHEIFNDRRLIILTVRQVPQVDGLRVSLAVIPEYIWAAGIQGVLNHLWTILTLLEHSQKEQSVSML